MYKYWAVRRPRTALNKPALRVSPYQIDYTGKAIRTKLDGVL